jgi:hypothetical protein
VPLRTTHRRNPSRALVHTALGAFGCITYQDTNREVLSQGILDSSTWPLAHLLARLLPVTDSDIALVYHRASRRKNRLRMSGNTSGADQKDHHAELHASSHCRHLQKARCRLCLSRSCRWYGCWRANCAWRLCRRGSR